jgi:type I restriction enzyme S subunit
MSNWKNCTLADLGEIIGGATPSTKNESYYGGDIPWITPKDLSTFHGRFICRGERNITTDGLNTCSARLMPPHSVLFTSRAPIGYVAIAENEICTNQGFKSIVPNADTDYLFLYYLLVHNRDRIENMGSGTTFKEVSGSVMRGITVSVPTDIEKQRAIARILGSLDDKIENNAAINHHLEQMAQAIFKSWFVDFEPFGGERPIDWHIVEFSSFLTLRTEKSNDPTIPLFSVTDTGIYPRGEKFNKNLSKADTKNKIARETDIVFGMSREILNWGIMRSPIGGVSSAYNVFAVDSGINSKYLESFIRAHSFYFKDLIRPATREGQGVDKGALMLKSIYLPPDNVLFDYYTIEDTLTAQIREKKAESARLATLRDTLLPHLMSGELSVANLGSAK